MASTKARARWAELPVSAAVLLLAALLLWNCLDIYRIGTSAENLGADGVHLADIYTREDVTARLARIGWSFWLLLGALLCAALWRHFFPCAPAKPCLSPDMRLKALLLRRSKTPALLAEERKRRLYALLGGGVCTVCALPAALYLLSPAAFASTDLEAVMAALMAHTLPWLLIAFAAQMVLAQARHRSILRELDAAKTAPMQPAQQQAPSPVWRRGVQAVLLTAAAGLILAGILGGGMYDVLVKAVNICTECIGLG